MQDSGKLVTKGACRLHGLSWPFKANLLDVLASLTL